ncbi:hypothetical protein Tco_0834124 [Tanacetum coccineum]
MSSPNHPTSDIKEAFSSNFPDYISASPNYIPALPGKTYSSFSNNSFGNHLFYHQLLYLQCLILKNSFFWKNFCHLRNTAITNHSPLLLPYLKNLRWEKALVKTSLERYKEQIKEIQNYLDELSLDRIEHIEDKIEGLRKGRVIIQQDFDNLEAELQKAHARIAKLQRKQMGNNNKIALARFRIANLEQIIKEIQACHSETIADSVTTLLERTTANMANTDNTTKPREDPVARQCSYKEFMSCQPINFKDSEKMMEVFIGGLPRSIKGNVTASKPQTLEEAINIAQRLMDQKSDEKRLEDIPVVREFPEVFLEDLPGLPHVRQVEFQIDLIPEATPVARAPYRLFPLEMQELSNQLLELAD